MKFYTNTKNRISRFVNKFVNKFVNVFNKISKITYTNSKNNIVVRE